MTRRLLLGAIAIVSFLFSAEVVSAEEPLRVRRSMVTAGQEFVPDEILVKFKSSIAQDVIDNLLLRHGLTLRATTRFADVVRLKIPLGATVEQMIGRLRFDPTIEYAEPNYIAHAFLVPNDEFYRYQWHLDNPRSGGIQAEEAWDKTFGNLNVIVAVVDTGIAYEDYAQGTRRYYRAPDLAQTTFAPGYDFVNDDTHPNDDEGHGTHVAGTIAQSTNNAIGVAGVAFGCTLMPVKVLDGRGSGTYADVADGIRFAADHGARVINLSLGGSSSSWTLRNALTYARGKGVIPVCASGNNGSSTTISYPAAYSECVAVGATRFDERLAPYSNRGSALDVVAPGGDLNVDQNSDGYPDGVLQQTFGNSTDDWGYWFYQGTSMATPHVSGVAALMLAQGIASTPDEVQQVLQATAKDLGAAGWDPQFGYGLVNAAAALGYSSTPNRAPVAEAGGPYNGTEDVAVTFDGSQSSDADGDPLSFAWEFGDGTQGSGPAPSHAYAAGGAYTVRLVVNDGHADSAVSTTTAQIAEVNDPPVASAGADRSAPAGATVTFDGSASYDPDGSISAYVWNFGDGTSATGATVLHAYAAAGTFLVELTVTDQGGLTARDTVVVTVTDASSAVEVFTDSFEVSEWNGQWTEDSQNDWYRSTQRATAGKAAAEVHGRAEDAQLISRPIELGGRTNAVVTFAWYLESSIDAGEYLAFDISTDNGLSWTEQARLRGNVDAENTWHSARIELSNLSALRLRFRGAMSSFIEDADVDDVKVIAQ